MSELLIGCGSSRNKRMGVSGSKEDDSGWQDLTTLDNVTSHHPDVVWDLNVMPWPFEDSQFDEVHAYEVLEHLGQQGDYVSFFATFSEIWRVLKPQGHLLGSCPSPHSSWVWGDPSHTRAILPESFIFLNQQQYAEQVGVTSMSDFRHIYKADFEPTMLTVKDDTFSFVLQALKDAA